MNTRARVPAREFRSALLIACDCICSARDELCALDAAAGDGDLGVTLATGFEHVRTSLEGCEEASVGADLTRVGMELARNAPSTMGTLLANAFLRAGREFGDAFEIGGCQAAAMLAAAASGVAESGGVTTGQRTVLDAMDAGATAAAAAAERGLGSLDTLRAAAAGARAGAETTADMEPQVGRAAWIRERAWGNVDAGAAAWATFLEGLVYGVETYVNDQ